MVGNKNTYLTAVRLNKFCDGVKLLEYSGSTDNKTYSFTLNGVTVTIDVPKAFKSDLSTACSASNGTTATSNTSASRYGTRVLYFSDGASGSVIGTNLYVVAIHFENGFFKVDDVGVIRKTVTTTLTQGDTFANQNTALGNLDVEWLNKVIK